MRHTTSHDLYARSGIHREAPTEKVPPRNTGPETRTINLPRLSGGLLAALLFAALPLSAQVPPGWSVVSSYRMVTNPAYPSMAGQGGLFLVHPRSGAVVPVTGLPAAITGCQWPATPFTGTDCVLIRPDGTVAATSAAPVGNQTALHLFSLSTPPPGNPVTWATVIGPSVPYNLGSVAPGSAVRVPQTANLPALPPNQAPRILLALDRIGIFGEPLYQATLGIVDPSIPPNTPGAVTAVGLGSWLPSTSQSVNALAADPTGARAWFGTFDCAAGQSVIYEASLVVPGLPIQRLVLPGHVVTALVYDSATQSLYAGTSIGCSNALSQGAILQLLPNPAGWTWIQTAATTGAAVNGLALEAMTGDLLAVLTSSVQPAGVYRFSGGAGPPTLLSFGPGAGWTPPCAGPATWGPLGGIDIAPDPEEVGAGTPGASATYVWTLNPNSLPYAGNPAFTLTLATTGAGCSGGFLGISFAALSPPLTVGPVQVHIDPYQLIVPPEGLPCSTAITTPPVAIPATLPPGVTLYFQSVHFDGGASPAIAVTTL